MPRPDVLDNFEGMDPLGNVRTSIDWAFSPTGDAALGLYLTIAAVPIWMRFAKVLECRKYVARALEVLASNPQPGLDLEMSLLTGQGMALLPIIVAGPEARQSFERALKIAEDSGNMDYQVRSLWGLCSVCPQRRRLQGRRGGRQTLPRACLRIGRYRRHNLGRPAFGWRANGSRRTSAPRATPYGKISGTVRPRR